MNKVALILEVIFSLYVVIAPGKTKIDTHSNVLLLNNENFDQALKEYKYILVDFYVPYCKKCSTVLKSEWGVTGVTLNGDVRLGKVDISKGNNHKLAKRFELCEYPSFKFFKHGKIFEYGGGLTKKKILSWLDKKTAEIQAPILKSEKEYKSFLNDAKLNDHKISVIGYFLNTKSDGAKAFLEIADEGMVGVDFGMISDASVISDLEINDGQLIMHHNEMGDPIVLTVNSKKDEIEKAILKTKLPLLRDFVSYDMDMKVLGESFENHLFICTSFSSEKHAKDVEMLKKLAVGYKEKILFVLVNMDEYLERYSNILHFLGIYKAPAIALASIKKPGVTKYKPKSNDISEKNIGEFLENYVNGKISAIKDEL